MTLGRLINPTKKIQEELDKLGVSLRDAEGNIRPDFFVNLGLAMRGMSKAQKDATIAILGGMDGMRALSILTRQTIGDTLGLRRPAPPIRARPPTRQPRPYDWPHGRGLEPLEHPPGDRHLHRPVRDAGADRRSRMP